MLPMVGSLWKGAVKHGLLLDHQTLQADWQVFCGDSGQIAGLVDLVPDVAVCLTAGGLGFIGNFTVIPTASLKLCEVMDWFLQEILMEHVDMAALILSLDPQEFCLPAKTVCHN